MSDLALPAPENLRAPRGAKHVFVESDMYDICKRVAELDKRLFIYELEPPQGGYQWSVCERCTDGVERLVFRVKIGELDGRVIEKLRYIMGVPFERRFAEAEAQEAKWEKEREENELDELYERVGRPMLTDLERCGFIQRSTSYAKRGVRPRSRR